MISSGNSIVEENGVKDPSEYIIASLEKEISEKYDLAELDSRGHMINTRNPSEIASAYPESDLIIDVETTGWGFTHFSTDWNNYRVLYSAKLRLIDTKKETILAEGYCSRVPDKDDSAPSYEDLLADKAARLKSELHEAANYCIEEFRHIVLI